MSGLNETLKKAVEWGLFDYPTDEQIETLKEKVGENPPLSHAKITLEVTKPDDTKVTFVMTPSEWGVSTYENFSMITFEEMASGESEYLLVAKASKVERA